MCPDIRQKSLKTRLNQSSTRQQKLYTRNIYGQGGEGSFECFSDMRKQKKNNNKNNNSSSNNNNNNNNNNLNFHSSSLDAFFCHTDSG